ncbi:MAG: Sec-independent protein translocase protein TatB [Methyloversatilis sp.]|jgi:sec-independent protein translocase protein TatB|nr:Sec-independent protein translocase protein TatB [Methyloversatilis sp.]
MFDIGFSEFFIIGIVALIVLGPERLPRVARTAGHLLGRLQRYVSDVKADISKEMQLEELRKLQSQVEQQVREVERQASEATSSVTKEVDGLSDQMRAAMAEQEKYAAIEQAGAVQIAEPAPAAAPAPEPVSGQLSLDIPPPEVKPVSSDKT